MTTTMPQQFSWRLLTKHEPRLRTLLGQIKAITPTEDFCANRVWHAQFRPQLRILVGSHRAEGPPPLQAREAYDCAYDTLYAALPDCRDCACL